MKTVNTVFLNEEDYLGQIYQPFNSISDIIVNRDANRDRNRANASTYASLDETGTLQIFAKTFGANKFESILLALASQYLAEYPVEVYEIQEGNLSILPEPARQLLIDSGIRVETSDIILERAEFETNDSLRSPTYLYNLLAKLGQRKCCFCECEIPQIVQGAHIWPVASIKRDNSLNLNAKLLHALHEDNGIWLCNNHHKLFDINLLYLLPDGRLKYKTNIDPVHEQFIKGTSILTQLPASILTANFLDYLQKRNQSLNPQQYSFVA